MAIALIHQDDDPEQTSPEHVIAEHCRIYKLLAARDVFEAQLAILEHTDRNENHLAAIEATA